MLSLRDIVKTYTTGDTAVTALQGVSIDFRESEFVSILGPSGCGKTTLLNIIGGLDRYTSGDLVINGRSTKEYKDKDWDTYRNHSVGFVFQSYNLIMHQSVLSNVELALTLSGVSREERRRRAIDALTQVGLGDQLHKKPNQMSGGQMQRVAIARALVNDPDILLADEPTGALDTATSVQIMEILKRVSEKKLIIMVTHNPELAEQYSTRIIRVLDGRVTDDSDPYNPAQVAELTEEPVEPALAEQPAEQPVEQDEAPESAPKKAVKKGKRSMSFFTALSLSFNNLLTKKTRTLLVSVAGSIGIIGIALILALSNGVNLFIASVQEETLTSYPISITAQTSDYEAILSAMVGTDDDDDRIVEPGKVYVDDSISEMVSAMTTMKKNNLGAFNEYLMSRYDEIKDDIMAIQYSYNMDLQIFNAGTKYGQNGVLQVNPSGVLSDFSAQNSGLSMITDSISIFSEIMPGRDGELINDTIYSQYELVDGNWPKDAHELVLVVGRDHTVSNITLYILGMLNPDEMMAMMASMMMGEKYEVNTSEVEFTFQDFYDLDLNLAYNTDFFAQKENATYDVNGTKLPLWHDLREDPDFLPETVYDGGEKLKIVGVIAPAEDATSTSISGSVAYTQALTELVLEKANDSEIVKQQIEYKTHDVFTGLPFRLDDVDTLTPAQKVEKLSKYFRSLSDAGKVAAYMAIRTEISDEQMKSYLDTVKKTFSDVNDQREFLINLYAFNSKKGSLAEGTFANLAVATLLQAIEPMDSVEIYKKMVADQYADILGLDGVEVKQGSAVYEKYKGLIDTLYDTPEKMTDAFETMTVRTINMVYPMVEAVNVQKELLNPMAPTAHYQQYVADMRAENPDMRQYLYEELCDENGVSHEQQIGLAAHLKAYVDGLSDMQVMTEFQTRLFRAYAERISADTDFYNEAAASLFEAYLDGLSEEDYAALYANHMQKADVTYEENLEAMGASVGYDALTAINIYPVDFEAKERLTQLISDYNETVENEEEEISYTDLMAILMSSVTIIIDAITYVLIAFVSISLVVSSIMIGIITYISVLERTKEIGILRAIGASKRDISRVFNAETLIIGFAAGAIGILTTLLFCIPINLILKAVTGMSNIRAVLPVGAAFILVGISMALTLIAGLIPSRIASKKDPVEALRSE